MDTCVRAAAAATCSTSTRAAVCSRDRPEPRLSTLKPLSSAWPQLGCLLALGLIFYFFGLFCGLVDPRLRCTLHTFFLWEAFHVLVPFSLLCHARAPFFHRDVADELIFGCLQVRVSSPEFSDLHTPKRC